MGGTTLTAAATQDGPRHDKVLVVDDEEDIRLSMQQLLEMSLQDVNVILRSNGEDALERLKKGDVDMVIADYRMPGMDGLELLQEANRVAPDVPRILMTAFGDLDVALGAINEAHVQNFFPKPFDPTKVVDVVWKTLDERWDQLQRKALDQRSVKSIQEADAEQAHDHDADTTQEDGHAR